METTPYFGELALLCLLLLRVIVARNPPCRMVTSHGKLCMFFLNEEIGQAVLLRKFIAQSHSLVVNTEPNNDITLRRGLMQRYRQLVIMVSDGCGLPPNRFPCLVKGGCLRVFNRKPIHQVGFPKPLGGVLVLHQFQAQARRFHHSFSFVGHGIGGYAIALQTKVDAYIAIGRFDYLCQQCHWQHKKQKNKVDFLHDVVVQRYATRAQALVAIGVRGRVSAPSRL